jgi:Phage terminase-like protein, large subunit
MDITINNINEIWAFHPVGMMRAAGYEPDEWQKTLLRSQSDRILLLCGRQMGKSTTVACLALHKAMFTSNALALLIAPTERQSKELFIKVLAVYYALGQPTPPCERPDCHYTNTIKWLAHHNIARRS